MRAKRSIGVGVSKKRSSIGILSCVNIHTRPSLRDGHPPLKREGKESVHRKVASPATHLPMRCDLVHKGRGEEQAPLARRASLEVVIFAVAASHPLQMIGIGPHTNPPFFRGRQPTSIVSRHTLSGSRWRIAE